MLACVIPHNIWLKVSKCGRLLLLCYSVVEKKKRKISLDPQTNIPASDGNKLLSRRYEVHQQKIKISVVNI